MSSVQYPFIDIAVNGRVRARFAAGEGMVLFSSDMRAPLWANGRGAALFGFTSIYDLIDQGPNRSDVAYRQVEAAARQLARTGDSRTLAVRATSGFQRVVIQAVCELVEISGERAVLFSAASEQADLSKQACSARMIEGFEDPDTHIAVFDETGATIAASDHFGELGISEQTILMLATMAGKDASRLAKRPISTVRGYLPAAMGKLSDEPALYLLFTVDTVGNEMAPGTAPGAAADMQMPADLPASMTETQAEAIDAIAEIEDAPDLQEELSLFAEEAPDADIRSGDAVADAVPFETAQEHGEAVVAAISAADETDGGDASAETDPVEPGLVDPSLAEPGVVTPAETEEDGLAETEQAAQPLTPAEPETSSLVPEPPEPPDAVETDVLPVADDQTEAATGVKPIAEGFTFRSEARATRFVWKIDAGGYFTEVSSEFAATVGPHAADVIGMAFADLAALFHLDPEGRIVELLNKRDTWSGKTIWWPVEGTPLIVPVDLAALPTYTRTREFDGFRGFGIVRIADAAEDPNGVGLTLGHDAFADVEDDDVTNETPFDETTAAASESAAGGNGTATEALSADGDQAKDESPGDSDRLAASEAVGTQVGSGADDTLTPSADISKTDTPPHLQLPLQPSSDWPPGERPALRLVDNPGRRQSDKIIQLEEHRPRLSPVEQAAFREIARQLDRFVGGEEESQTADQGSAADAAPDKPAPTPETPRQLAGADPHTLLNRENDAAADVTEEGVEDAGRDGPAEAEAALSSSQDAGVEHPDSSGETLPDDAAGDPETDAENVNLNAPEEPASAGATDEPDSRLSDRELLQSMIQVRERIGLSADIVDQMPVALLVHGGDQLFHGNPEFLKLTGYGSLSELEEVGGLDALLQRQDLDGKAAMAGGMVVVRADDEIVPVIAKLQSVRWGDSTALMLALMPTGAEHEAEDADAAAGERPDGEADIIPFRDGRPADQLVRLQVEVEELRAILETATDGVVIIDASGEVRSLNRAASALFNYDDEEINGKPFVMLFAHESQRAIVDYLSGLSGHGVASVLNDGREVIGREASGGFLPLFMTIGRLTSSNGYCAVIRDITQWKRTEEELRTAKRAAETANAHKSEFLAHVSHEIRTPLNAIIGFSDMMASERFGPVGHPRYVEYSNDIGRSGRHVLDIVNDLLDISKIEAGEMELDFISVGLNETVSEAVSLVQPQANGQRVIIRTALSQAVPPVVADLRSVKQIVLNILSNAIRFTPSGGQIVVSTAYEPNGNVVLRVRDTGIGMTRSELELAMKPFRQVAGAARKRGDGTGLGLPLTKAMVDANRAAFAINSAPNEGTLVEITFPSPRVLAT